MKYKKALSFTLQLSITIILFYFIFTQIEFYDTVTLKTGEQLTGKIITKGPLEVQIETEGKQQTISLEDIAVSPTTQDFEISWGLIYVTKNINVFMFISFSLLFTINLFLTSIRFCWLLQSQNIDIGYFHSFRICFIGIFFNNVLPGVTGGDLIKAVYVIRYSKKRAIPLITVLIDRVLGLAALIILASLVVLSNYHLPEIYEVGFFVLLIFAGLILGIIIAFMIPKRWFEDRPNPFCKLVCVLLKYRDNHWLLVKCVAISIPVHCFTCLAAYGYSMSLGITEVSPMVFFVYVPIGFLVMMLPISLAGWGLGEATYAFLFTKVGLSSAEAIVLSILTRFGQMFVSLFGGIFYLFEGKLSKQELENREILNEIERC